MSKTQKSLPDGVSVHAGFPNPASDITQLSLDLNSLLIKHPSATFIMRIHGHQWEEQGICNGDIAIIDRALTPRKTDRVIWWQNNNFIISPARQLPAKTEVWGVVTSIIHVYLK